MQKNIRVKYINGLTDYEKARNRILADPCTQKMVKDVLELCESKDSTDAINNLSIVKHLMQMKNAEHLGQYMPNIAGRCPKCWSGNKITHALMDGSLNDEVCTPCYNLLKR